MQFFTFDFQTLWVRSKKKELNNTLRPVFLALETSKFCINWREGKKIKLEIKRTWWVFEKEPFPLWPTPGSEKSREMPWKFWEARGVTNLYFISPWSPGKRPHLRLPSWEGVDEMCKWCGFLDWRKSLTQTLGRRCGNSPVLSRLALMGQRALRNLRVLVVRRKAWPLWINKWSPDRIAAVIPNSVKDSWQHSTKLY